MRIFWLALGWLSIGCGVLGIVLPLLPTTPFLLLAAYAFSRGSERLHQWILHHRVFGPPIVDWHEHRAIARRTKLVATASIILIFALTLLIGVPLWALISQATVLAIVLGFLWSTQERPALVLPPPDQSLNAEGSANLPATAGTRQATQTQTEARDSPGSP